ncbi:MAG: hypothetical protein ACRDZM_13995 [Acidimicrobiia bacterium]
MGQTVVINNVVEMGDLLLIDTDRSFTGQDGAAITPSDPGDAVPGKLGRRLFEVDLGIDYVYVLQNAVTVRRPGGWDEEAKAAALGAVEGFLLFY